jgi:methylglyoxal synthase
VQPERFRVDAVRTGKERRGHPAGALRATVGIVAHDAMKDEVCLFFRAHRELLERVWIIAPEDTARALDEIGLAVETLMPDARGGDLQLAAAVVEGRVDAVLFIQDPLVSLAGEPDIQAMMKVCDLEKIPLATNLTTAKIVLNHLTDARMLAEPPLDARFEAVHVGRVIRLESVPGGDHGRRGKVKR